MDFLTYRVSALPVLALGYAGLLLAFGAAIWGWRAEHRPLLLAYAVATASWFVYLAGTHAGGVVQTHTLAFFLARAAGQVAIMGLLFFLLISASLIHFETHAVWMVQGTVGVLLLLWNGWGPWLQGWAYPLWFALNTVCIVWLASRCVLRVQALGAGHKRRWLALGAGLLGLAICMAGALGAAQTVSGNTLAQLLYAFFLPVVGWALFVQPVKRLVTSNTGEAEGRLRTTAWDAVTGFGPQDDSIAAAVAGERRRIAQDLHDGVCSQLVNILATLNAHSPQQQHIAQALEQCLVDLKIMVDVIDDADDSLIDALGRLRYRVQGGLDALSIEMNWAVDVYGPLQNLHGNTAKQVLRIAQECLSNVMRHSQATRVEVVCSYLPANNFMLLEVRDNGKGIPGGEAGRPGGKGLSGMKERARSLGANLQIFTKPGGGTRVRLLVPLAPGKPQKRQSILKRERALQ